MEPIEFRKPHSPGRCPPEPEITERDRERYLRTIDTRLTPGQVARIVHPGTVYTRQENVLAVHWHPEFVPLTLIRERYRALFPNRRLELVIPTQHNILLSHGDFAGVEVDCHSRGFNRKVQLLLHFKKERLNRAGTLESMLSHTFKYRSSQLFDLMHTFTKPVEERLQAAARTTAAGEDLVCFVQDVVRKIEVLMEEYWDATPAEAVKNKLLRNYLDLLRQEHDPRLIERAQAYVRAVKKIVKAEFPLTYFYRTSEIIEEARSLGGGVVIPHPEQFWPILMADYDVDGFEVWNPGSRKYTEFLITVLNRKNRSLGHGMRRQLVFMGDDTHMGEKVKDPVRQDPDKASREIGVQPAWDDPRISKQCRIAESERSRVITEYRERLEG